MNSLQKRIDKLERELDGDEQPDLFVKIKQRQQQKKNELINELTSKYLEYLEKQSLIENIENNLIEVLYYTIKYINQNAVNISRLLELKVTDNFNDVVLFLIQLNISDVNEDMIVNGINFMNKLELKESVIDSSQPEPEPELKQKKSFFKKCK